MNGSIKLPYIKKPCCDCPFRKDSPAGWLGRRMKEILGYPSFVCHKTIGDNQQQCAGHMLLKGTDNAFVRLAKDMNIDLNMSGHDLVFDTEEECIKHHRGFSG